LAQALSAQTVYRKSLCLCWRVALLIPRIAMKAMKIDNNALMTDGSKGAAATKSTKGKRTMKAKALIPAQVQSRPGAFGNFAKRHSANKALNPTQKKKLREQLDRKSDDVKATGDAVMGATAMKSMKAEASKASKKVVKAMRSMKAKVGVSARSRKHEGSLGKFAKRVSLKTIKSNGKKKSEQESDEEDDEDEQTAKPPAKKARMAQKPSTVTMKKRIEAEKKDKQDESDDDDDDDDDDDYDDDDDDEEDKVDEEEKAAERKKELKSMDKMALKKLLDNEGLEARTKGEMVECLLAHEARGREELKAHKTKVQEVLAQRRTELQAMPNPDLKELCEKKNLKLGGKKEERVERLLTFAQHNGEVEQVLASQARESRREELLRMDTTVLSNLCSKAGVDPFVKEVMVERILARESAAVPTKGDVGRSETLAKGTKVKKMMKAMKAQ